MNQGDLESADLFESIVPLFVLFHLLLQICDLLHGISIVSSCPFQTLLVLTTLNTFFGKL